MDEVAAVTVVEAVALERAPQHGAAAAHVLHEHAGGEHHEQRIEVHATTDLGCDEAHEQHEEVEPALADEAQPGRQDGKPPV